MKLRLAKAASRAVAWLGNSTWPKLIYDPGHLFAWLCMDKTKFCPVTLFIHVLH